MADDRTTVSRAADTISLADEEKVREMAEIGHRWRNPVWRTADGTVTEW